MSATTSHGLRWRSATLLTLATVCLAGAEAGLLLHAWLPTSVRAWLQLLYNPIFPLTALLCVLAGRSAPDRVARRTWWLLAGAASVLLVTAALFWIPKLVWPTFPSTMADTLAGARQLLVAAALFSLVPPSDRREARVEFAVDVAVVVGAGMLVALQMWIGIPAVDSTQLLVPAAPAFLVATAGAAAVSFIAMSYVAVRSSALPRGWPVRLALVATVPTILVDVLVAIAPQRWAFLSAPVTAFSTWLLAIAAFMYVRHPTSVTVQLHAPGERGHSVAPYIALGIVELVLVLEALRVEGLAARVLLLGVGVLLALVVVRQFVALRENAALVRARALEQERVARLARNARDAAVLVAADGTIRFDVPVLARLLGAPETALAGQSLLRFIEASERQTLEQYLGNLEPGETAVPLTVGASRTDGAAHYLEVVAANHLEDPALQGYVLNIRDVTERVLLESQLRESQKMEGIGRLAGGVAHDFNNLLTAIISNCELLETDPATTGEAAEEIRDIRRAADRAADLTRQLLQFARRQIIAPRVLLLESVLAQIERLLKRVLTEHIELRIDCRGGPLRIKADPTQLDQVILNLVVNARDAMPRGGQLSITARARTLSESEQQRVELANAPHVVELRVSDTGVGMTPEVLSRIFEPFYTTKGVGEGTGLGLATAYGIVRQLGGHIGVDSAPDAGTTFTILLRATNEPADSEQSPTPVVPLPRRGRGTVLVAEDEAAVRTITVRVLRERGFEVLPAVDGEDALRVARTHDGPIHFLVSDLVMPHMGGVQLAALLRAMGHAPRVLFITGYAEGGELDRVGDVRGAEVLVKPFPPSSLLASIDRMGEREPAA